MKHDDSRAVITRLRKIEGQVRGLIRMMEEERYCIDVLQQLTATKAALLKVETAILRRHAATCVEAAIHSGDEAAQRRIFDELVELLEGVRR